VKNEQTEVEECNITAIKTRNIKSSSLR